MSSGTRLSAGQLRGATLARQFPAAWTGGAPDRAALLDLVGRVGPIQSQVPRSPFLVASSRLPGIGYPVVRDAFAAHDLLKTTSLRGTVHTTTREQYVWTDAVTRPERGKLVRRVLKLSTSGSDRLFGALEDFTADDWRERGAVVEQARDWLARYESDQASAALSGTFAENVVWGHSGLVRRPRDDRWEKRTDTWHRDARAVLGEQVLPRVEYGDALRALVRVHLAAFGPATEVDIAWWLGIPLTPVRRALGGLGWEVEPLTGPDGEPLLDLAELDAGVDGDPGLRLLPEFDSLMLGYHADHRDRFVGRDDLARVWSKANGLWAPAVLNGQHLVATWKTVTLSPGRARIEVTPFARGHGLTPAGLDGPAGDTARVLDLEITDVVIRPPD